MLAGVQKGGTTALTHHLKGCANGTVCFTHAPEDHRFDHLSKRISLSVLLADVERRCPRTHESSQPRYYGAKDPAFIYLVNEATASRLNEIAPKMRIIVLLREPVQRSFSQYSMVVPKRPEKRKPMTSEDCFLEAMRKEWHTPPRKPTPFDTLRRGFYFSQLSNLHRLFGADRIQVTISERVFANDSQLHQEYGRILDFIGAPPVPIWHPVETFPGKPKNLTFTHTAKLFLRNVFFNDTKSLYTMLGHVVPEWESWYAKEGLPLV